MGTVQYNIQSDIFIVLRGRWPPRWRHAEEVLSPPPPPPPPLVPRHTVHSPHATRRRRTISDPCRISISDIRLIMSLFPLSLRPSSLGCTWAIVLPRPPLGGPVSSRWYSQGRISAGALGARARAAEPPSVKPPPPENSILQNIKIWFWNIASAIWLRFNL